MDEIKAMRHELDTLGASQLAQSIIIQVLMAQSRGRPEVIAYAREAAEKLKAGMLASSSSDLKLERFEELIQIYIEGLGG